MAIGIRFSTAPPTLNNSISFKYFIDQTNASKGLPRSVPVSASAVYTNGIS